MAGFDVQAGPVVDGLMWVLVVGDVDVAVSDLVRRVLTDACQADGVRMVEVDLSRASFMDASGLSALLAARNAALARGRTFGVRGASGIVWRVMEITGTLAVLDAKTDGGDHERY